MTGREDRSRDSSFCYGKPNGGNSGTPRSWTQSETEYFSKLNDDDDYMEMELSRVNLLESLERGKKTSLKIALVALPLIIFGFILNENLVVNIGWAVSSVSFLIWAGIIMSRNMLSARVPVDFE